MNQINPLNFDDQRDAFVAGGLSVAALLHHEFTHPKMQYSRELDPIVGVSFTGLFDFFVNAFGVEWLQWWQSGRKCFTTSNISSELVDILLAFHLTPSDYYDSKSEEYNLSIIFSTLEREYLSWWKDIVRDTIESYCEVHNLKMPNRYTTVQPAGCLTKEYLRVFDQGLFYADEHMDEAEGEVNLEYYNLSVREGVPVKAGIANDKLPLVKLTLANGRTLKLTPNHRLSVEEQWLFAEEMLPGMKIDFQLDTYRKEQEQSLVTVSNHYSGLGRHPLGCDLPSETSPDLGYFIGALFGNGCVSERKYRVRFSSGNESVLQKLKDIGYKLFGIEGTISHDSRGGRSEIVFANKQLYYWLLANGLHKSEKSKDLSRIPLNIRCASKYTILAFFAGLIDTDGCIRQQGSVSIDSASEDFIRHLQQIGEAVGLSWSFYKNNQGESYQDSKVMFGLCLSRMHSIPKSLEFINGISVKASVRPIPLPKRYFEFSPYEVAKVEWIEPEYTYDYGVEGIDDDDSWYWQGALKSHNTKSLLTGASPGWHPPKSQRFIRRITFSRDHSVAKACIDYGYNVVPSQSCKDENDVLLDDPYDPRVNEWLIEIPVEVSWANLPGVDAIEIEKFSLKAQFDFYMQVQNYWTTHNTSATLEYYEDEIEDLAQCIYDACVNHKGYVSAAVQARFDAPFPRLPFENISKDVHDRMVDEVNQRRKSDDFLSLLNSHQQKLGEETAPAPCDGNVCDLSTSKK